MGLRYGGPNERGGYRTMPEAEEVESPGTVSYVPAAGAGILSMIPGLQPIGAALGAISAIASIIGGRKAQKEEEERRRKQEALQRAIQMSQSFEGAGRRWGY
jgi:hypothetical protein